MALKVGELFAELTLDTRPYAASLNSALKTLAAARDEMRARLQSHAAEAGEAAASAGANFTDRLLQALSAANVDEAVSNLSLRIRSVASALLSARGLEAGSHFSNGLAQGILSGRSRVSAAAESVARAAVSAANARLKIASPSRVMQETGAYFSEGFAQGVRRSARLAAEASSNLSAQAAGAASREKSAPALDYERLGSIVNRREIALYLDGKQLARVSAAQNERAQRERRRSLALGYGVNGR